MTVDFEKYDMLRQLNEGDTVALDNGDVAIFIRLKRKNFIGTIDGRSYDIPVAMYKEVVERVDMERVKKELEVGYNSLEQGDLFYLKKGGDAILYIFKEIKNGRIIGKNPLTGGMARIDVSLYAGKVSEL